MKTNHLQKPLYRTKTWASYNQDKHSSEPFRQIRNAKKEYIESDEAGEEDWKDSRKLLKKPDHSNWDYTPR